MLGRECNRLFEVRRSSIHGRGVVAIERIRQGTRVIEYVGELLSSAELNVRYDKDTPERGHTFVFHVADDTYIDAVREGNDSRFINHSCDPIVKRTSTMAGFLSGLKRIFSRRRTNLRLLSGNRG